MTITDEQIQQLIQTALEAREMAYCPYSKFRVGAGLLTATGKFYSGCNVENASYGGAICAERTAIVKAVSEGERKDVEDYLSPCGFCRQFIGEFGGDIKVYMAQSNGQYMCNTLDELLPRRFGPEHLGIPPP